MKVERKQVSAAEGLAILGLAEKGQITVATQINREHLCDYWKVGDRVMTRRGEVVTASVTTPEGKPAAVTFWLR
jgi:hypothetical protein